MRGYHYTSWENYKVIRQEGLIPYRVTKPVVVEMLGGVVNAIWTWKSKAVGMTHHGQIIWMMMRRKTTRVVLISYDYEPEDCIQYDDKPILILHSGKLCITETNGKNLSEWEYHDREPATLVAVRVPPDKIKLEAAYDFGYMVAAADATSWEQESNGE